MHLLNINVPILTVEPCRNTLTYKKITPTKLIELWVIRNNLWVRK